MKIRNTFILALLVLAGCQSDTSNQANQAADSAEVVPSTNMDHEKVLVLPWVATVNDTTHKMEIRKDASANMNHLEPADLVDALNIKYPQIKLEWIKQDGNKAFVKIDDASYLTQQTGNDGAQAYLAEMTYALTELPGIRFVDIRFTQGDHAQPGVYHRQSFRGL